MRIHVIPHSGKWAVAPEGKKGLIAVYDTKEAAIDAARKIARGGFNGRNVLVHGKTGQIFRGAEAPSTIDEHRLRDVVRTVIKTSRRRSMRRRKTGSGRLATPVL